jgi:hypothetical protein
MAVLMGLNYAVSFGGPALIGLVAPKDMAERITAFVAQPLMIFALEPLAVALVTATYLELRRSAGSPSMQPVR